MRDLYSMETVRIKWWQLSLSEIYVFVSSLLILPYYARLLKLVNLPDLLQSVSSTQIRTPKLVSYQKARRMGIVVNKATSLLLGTDRCLLRSVLLQRILSRRSIVSELKVGVLPSQTSFKAHAWVEVEGVPVNDRVDVGDQYKPFDSLPTHANFSGS